MLNCNIIMKQRELILILICTLRKKQVFTLYINCNKIMFFNNMTLNGVQN